MYLYLQWNVLITVQRQQLAESVALPCLSSVTIHVLVKIYRPLLCSSISHVCEGTAPAWTNFYGMWLHLLSIMYHVRELIPFWNCNYWQRCAYMYVLIVGCVGNFSVVDPFDVMDCVHICHIQCSAKEAIM